MGFLCPHFQDKKCAAGEFPSDCSDNPSDYQKCRIYQYGKNRVNVTSFNAFELQEVQIRDYHGTRLNASDCVAMEKIEQILGTIIPNLTPVKNELLMISKQVVQEKQVYTRTDISAQLTKYMAKMQIKRHPFENKGFSPNSASPMMLEALSKEEEDNPDLAKDLQHDRFGFYVDEGNVSQLRFSSLPSTIDLTSFISELILFKSLTHLSLKNAGLTSLPESIGNLHSLEFLDVSENELTSLPEAISNLQILQTLDLHGNKLTSLPVTLGNLQSLSKLVLGSNPIWPDDAVTIESWVDEFHIQVDRDAVNPVGIDWDGFLNALLAFGFVAEMDKKQLEWGAREANSASKDSGKKVEEYNIPKASHKRVIVPEEDAALNQLERETGLIIPAKDREDGKVGFMAVGGFILSLNLSRQNLVAIPEVITAFSRLKKLNLSNNKISFLPEKILKCNSLVDLNIANNHLTSLPKTIGSLDKLQKLNFNNNQLTFLPDSIGQISALEQLYLRSNHLETIPETIGNLQSLTRLDISKNQINSLPTALQNLKSLTSFWLTHNLLKDFPKPLKKWLKLLETAYNDVWADFNENGRILSSYVDLVHHRRERLLLAIISAKKNIEKSKVEINQMKEEVKLTRNQQLDQRNLGEEEKNNLISNLSDASKLAASEGKRIESDIKDLQDEEKTAFLKQVEAKILADPSFNRRIVPLRKEFPIPLTYNLKAIAKITDIIAIIEKLMSQGRLQGMLWNNIFFSFSAGEQIIKKLAETLKEVSFNELSKHFSDLDQGVLIKYLESLLAMQSGYFEFNRDRGVLILSSGKDR